MSDPDMSRRIVCDSGEGDECDGATFIPRCVKCNRYVKPDATIKVNWQGQPVGDNATCSKCGRTEMIWEGYP